MESRASRRVRALALLVFAATAFLPLHVSGPVARAASAPVSARRAHPKTPAQQVAVVDLRATLSDGYAEDGLVGAVWRSRAGYPYLLLPVWALALLLASSLRGRRAAGGLMLVTSLLVAVLEWHYIRAEYSGVLPVTWRQAELAIAWTTVAGILFLRRPGRALLDADAAVSGHALLAGLHGLTFPIADARDWSAAGISVERIASTLLANYPWPFWVAVLACFVAAIPGYRRLTAPASSDALPAPAPASPALAADGTPAPPDGG